jgi:hypothetical protein
MIASNLQITIKAALLPFLHPSSLSLLPVFRLFTFDFYLPSYYLLPHAFFRLTPQFPRVQ